MSTIRSIAAFMRVSGGGQSAMVIRTQSAVRQRESVAMIVSMADGRSSKRGDDSSETALLLLQSGKTSK